MKNIKNMRNMKKLAIFIIVFTMAILSSFSVTYAASLFTNNKALDSTFKKLEKEFLKYEREAKLSDKQVKTATNNKLNDIRVAIEIKEEELGGLSQQEYNLIADHFTYQLFFLRSSTFDWDFSGEIVVLFLNRYDTDLYGFKGLVGNFARMGKQKDEVNQADLKVKEKIKRYLNQSIQKGNEISPEILQKLPGEVEKLFVEKGLSKIVAARTLADIHQDIYTPEYVIYDGWKSIEEIIQTYGVWLDDNAEFRESEKIRENFKFPKDIPSSTYKSYILEMILDEELTESFTYGFNKAITLDELAKYYFESMELDEKIVIEDNIIKADSPDYIKNAFIYGMIDDGNNLEKTLTRVEAARKMINGTIYGKGMALLLRIADSGKISGDDQIAVASCIKGGMKPRVDKFEPQSKYTKEEVITDSYFFKFEYLRGYSIPFSLKEPSKIIVGKNTINLIFENNDEIKQYMEEYFDDTVLSKIKLTGSYTKIDTGCALIELFTPEKGIKFTIKKGSTFIDFKDGLYGPSLSYDIEPKVLKETDKVDLNMQPDTIHKKLYTKLDAIIAKIIKPGMTEEQKVKAIHDFVVNHMTYDSKYDVEPTIESLFTTIDKGRGSTRNYCQLFAYLCKRVSIPSYFEGEYLIMNHAWNVVYVNGEWLFVDTVWDDIDNNYSDRYFLVDRFTFMKDHIPYMGIPEEDVYKNLDNMNIKNQDELRGYLLQNFYWLDGFKLTFRMSDKKIKPLIGYLWPTEEIKKIELKYDSKKDLYTITARAK